MSERFENKPVNIAIRHPANILLSGSTGTGKTHIVYNLIKNKHFVCEKPYKKIFYFFSEWQNKFSDMENENLVDGFFQGMPDMTTLKKIISPGKKEETLVVFDDLMHQVTPVTANCFSVIGSRFNTSFCFLSQVLFNNDQNYKIINTNSHYIFLTKSPRVVSQLVPLARQIAPYEGGKELKEAFDLATKDKNYGYLLIDLHNKCPDNLRYKSNLFPEEFPVEVYVKN